jgi:hypothetical protein
MEITELPPIRFDLPGRDPVSIATQRWVLEPWEGEDPPSLGKIWARKPKFAVNGNRSCAELAIVHHLRDDGIVPLDTSGRTSFRCLWVRRGRLATCACRITGEDAGIASPARLTP